MIGVYEAQRDELNTLTQKLTALESEGAKQAEVKHLRTVLNNFDRILEATIDVMGKLMKELRLIKNTPNSLEKPPALSSLKQ